MKLPINSNHRITESWFGSSFKRERDSKFTGDSEVNNHQIKCSARLFHPQPPAGGPLPKEQGRLRRPMQYPLGTRSPIQAELPTNLKTTPARAAAKTRLISGADKDSIFSPLFCSLTLKFHWESTFAICISMFWSGTRRLFLQIWFLCSKSCARLAYVPWLVSSLLSLCFRSGVLAAARYNADTASLSVLSSVVELAPEFKMTKAILHQVINKTIPIWNSRSFHLFQGDAIEAFYVTFCQKHGFSYFDIYLSNSKLYLLSPKMGLFSWLEFPRIFRFDLAARYQRMKLYMHF